MREVVHNLKLFRSQPASWIQVHGDDAAEFLQSQFSNDLQRSQRQPLTYGLWLDRKGKICGDSFVLGRAGPVFILCSYASPADVIMEKLEQFIIADDVELEDRTASVEMISWWGCKADDVWNKLRWIGPKSGEFVEREGVFAFHGRRSKEMSYDMVGPRVSLGEWIGKLEIDSDSLSLCRYSDEEYALDRIRACIPAIPDEIGPGDLPQEAGLESEAVSFSKGCYLGQEVMARLHAMGRVQRELTLVDVPRDHPPLPAPLYDEARIAGELRAAVNGLGVANGLALMKRRALRNGSGFSFLPRGEIAVKVHSGCYSSHCQR